MSGLITHHLPADSACYRLSRTLWHIQFERSAILQAWPAESLSALFNSLGEGIGSLLEAFAS
jgi:hypothetical protein